MATFSIESMLRRELPMFGVPATTLGTVAGISSGMLSAYLNGQRPVPHDHEIKLRRAWSQIKRLVEFSAPLPLNLRRADKLRECIDLMESGGLTIVVFRPGDGVEAAEAVTTIEV